MTKWCITYGRDYCLHSPDAHNMISLSLQKQGRVGFVYNPLETHYGRFSVYTSILGLLFCIILIYEIAKLNIVSFVNLSDDQDHSVNLVIV